MWVEHGCRGVFECGGRDVQCGQAGDAVGYGRRRCECWFDTMLGNRRPINSSNGAVPKQAVFNVAYSWSAESRTWWGLGRYMQGRGHLGQCWRRDARVENHSHYLALTDDAQRTGLHEGYKSLPVPPNVACDNVGEPKWVTEPSVVRLLFGEPEGALDANARAVYAYTNGQCDTAHGWPHELAGRRREVYIASRYGNYLFALPPMPQRARHHAAAGAPREATPALATADATLLSYMTAPDPTDASAKNFLFFAAGGAVHVLALIEPHVVYTLGAPHGRSHVSHMAGPTHTTHARFGFGSHLRLSLSGGPVRVDSSTFLVAAHVPSAWLTQCPPSPLRSRARASLARVLLCAAP
jgi:hypothetical protein